uniref:hypothetical protein n=1 Tax=Citrobacter amalonaticus TaxID=35703 RepID=UPI000A808DA2
GDGYPRIDNKPGYVNTGFIDAEVLKEYIQKNSPLDASAYECCSARPGRKPECSGSS